MSATKQKKPATKNHTRQSGHQPEQGKTHVKPNAAADKPADDAQPQHCDDQLPPHPRGKVWSWRHIVAAKRAAAGHGWREIAAELGVKQCTAKDYSQIEGWSILFGHFRAIYLAELEDSLFEPALKALLKIVSGSDNEFAQLQAVGLILGERNRTYTRIDKALKTPKGDEAQNTVTVVDNTIQAPDDKPGN